VDADGERLYSALCGGGQQDGKHAMGDEIRTLIREALAEVEHDRCILFGSQARGDAGPDSDYDLLIVVRDPCSQGRRFAIANTVRAHLAHHLLPVDVIVRTTSEMEEHLLIPGSIVRNALAEGTAV
jgi:uncharacterized protein